ncbi:MAG TPA: glycosyltransferase, partial [Saliniramus sp.]|nr:glycosyltransferase [Saliniramus sp.]
MSILAIIALAMAGLAAVIGAINLVLVRTPPKNPIKPGTLVSILIPARNEEANIGAAIAAALASTNVDVEVVVMDDGSTDRTPEIVAGFAVRDPRVRLEHAPPLPEGWTGKVHACQKLADAAGGTHLLFVDADVRLAPQAAARLTAIADRLSMDVMS